MKQTSINKRANISIAILVIGIFLVCALTLLSFSISSQHSRKIFDDISAIEKIKLLEEKIGVYEKLGIENDIFINLGEQGEFIFMKQGKISVKYYLD